MNKVKPHHEHTEQVILGALLFVPDAIIKVSNILKTPEVFYLQKHQVIYKAISELSDEGKNINLITVISKLRKSGEYETAGQSKYIMFLTTLVYSDASIEEHAFICLEHYKKRQLIELLEKNIADAYDFQADILEQESNLFEEFLKQTANVSQGDFTKIDKATETYLNELDQRTQSNELEYPTGFPEIDKKTGGLQIGLQVLGARPAMGKTALAIQLLINFALRDIVVVFFSLEMTKSQLIGRVISNICSINSKALRDGTLTQEEHDRIIENTTEIISKNVFLSDEQLTTSGFRSMMQKMKMRFPDQEMLAIVDYLQLMQGSSKNREQEIRQIAETLRMTGNGLKIPVLALSQLSRGVEQTADKKPTLQHLRESGAIEQEAHTVIFLHRPEYYEIPEDKDGNPTEGKAYAIIAKCRNGDTGEVEMNFEGQFSRFTDPNVNSESDFNTMDNSVFQNAPNDFE